MKDATDATVRQIVIDQFEESQNSPQSDNSTNAFCSFADGIRSSPKHIQIFSG